MLATFYAIVPPWNGKQGVSLRRESESDKQRFIKRIAYFSQVAIPDDNFGISTLMRIKAFMVKTVVRL